jgi:hypothetical protein
MRKMSRIYTVQVPYPKMLLAQCGTEIGTPMSESKFRFQNRNQNRNSDVEIATEIEIPI